MRSILICLLAVSGILISRPVSCDPTVTWVEDPAVNGVISQESNATGVTVQAEWLLFVETNSSPNRSCDISTTLTAHTTNDDNSTNHNSTTESTTTLCLNSTVCDFSFFVPYGSSLEGLVYCAGAYPQEKNFTVNVTAPCPPGRTLAVVSEWLCAPCQPGKANPNQGDLGEGCSDCAINYYASNSGQTTCTACAHDHFTDEVGSTVCLVDNQPNAASQAVPSLLRLVLLLGCMLL